MQSCDTFALGKRFFSERKNILAKNSDRPLGEAQPFVFFAGGTHKSGSMLHCTHLTIPQAEHTYSVLGCQPYWIWGFEMGVNECGLVIGNEAEFSRCAAETEDGLLGMDLLRLALERAATAKEGVTVITSLLEQYGQSANANMLYERRYENSFLLVDPQEIWLLETAGRQWAARKVEDWAAISNCYSIGADYTLCSQNLEALARENRWLRPDEPFVFAKAYTAHPELQNRSVPRWRRMQRLIARQGGPLTLHHITSILRDHYDVSLVAPRFGACAGCFPTICMHAAAWDSSQTASSLLCSYDDLLGPVSRYAPSLPCCSVYIPVYFTGDTPSAMKTGGDCYDAASLWWTAERLSMLISADEMRYASTAREKLQVLEAQFVQSAAENELLARILCTDGHKDEAMTLLAQFTQRCVDQTIIIMQTLADEISKDIASAGGLYGPRSDFLKAYAQRVHMPL